MTYVDRTEPTPDRTTSAHPDWARHHREWIGRFRPATITSYGRWTAAWEAWCTARSLDPWDARRSDIEAWLAGLEARELAPATRALAYDSIKSLYTWLYEEELVDRHPVARVRRPVVHPEAQRRTWLPPLRYAAFLEAAEAMGPDEHAVAVLGGMMGLRSGEMCGIDVEHLSTVGSHHVVSYLGKGGRPAQSPIPVPAQRAVLPLAELRGTGALLRSRAGHRLCTRSMVRLVRRVADAAGLGDLTPHGLRRTFATTGMNAAGVSERDMMLAGRWVRAETMRRSYDMQLGLLDTHASHRIAGFLSGISG